MTYAAEVVNVAQGIFSKKVVSNGLQLPASNTFSPVSTLTTTVHLTKPHSVFVHYQFTLAISYQDFYGKLIVNDNNAGSLVHTGKQRHKNPTGFWMADLNAGYYTFEIHYKSPVAFNVAVNDDWQTAVLQVMWFEDARVVSDGIKCQLLPTTTTTGVPSMTFKLFYNYQTIEPYYQLISYLLKCLHPVIWLLLLMLMDSINHQLHVSKEIILFFPYKVLMLDNTVKEYIILMFSTDLLQHSPSLTANTITKTIKTCML